MAAGTTFWILFALSALLIIAIAWGWILKKGVRRPLSPLLAVAFACIIVAMVFDERAIAYSLLGAGVTVALIDAAIKQRKAREGQDLTATDEEE